MPIYDRGRVRRSLLDTVAFRALSQLATLAGYVVLVRSIPKQDFGLFNLLYAFIPAVSAVASLGLEQTLRRYQPEYLRAGRLDIAAWLVQRVSLVRLVSNVGILALLLLTWRYISPIFGLAPYRGQFMLFSVLVLLFFQVQIFQLSLAAHLMQRYSVGSIAMLSFVKLIAYAILAGRGLLNLQSAILTDTFAYFVVYVFLWQVNRRWCQPPRDQPLCAPQPAERRRMLSYGLFNNFNDAGTLFLDSRTDNFFIAAFTDAVSVGIYAFYTRLNEMTANVMPSRLFETVIQPMFFTVPRTEAAQRLPQYFTFLLNLNLALQWPVLAFSVAYHAQIVQVIFGGKFIEYSWLLPLVTALASANIVSTPVTLVAQYEERAGILLLSKIFAFANIIGMLVLIPVAGLYGAAIASGMSQFIKNLFVWWKVRRHAVWLNARAALQQGLVLWGAVVGVALGLQALWPAHAIVHLLLGVVLCGLAELVHLRGGAIWRDDRTLLMKLFHGRESRVLRWAGLAPTV